MEKTEIDLMYSCLGGILCVIAVGLLLGFFSGDVNEEQEEFIYITPPSPENVAEMLDCVAFNDLNVMNETFYSYHYSRPCFVLIEGNNVSMNLGKIRKEFYDYEIVSKKDFEFMTYHYKELTASSVERRTIGCFVEEDSFDLNSSFIDIFYVKKYRNYF